jgi:hypothetical protein
MAFIITETEIDEEGNQTYRIDFTFKHSSCVVTIEQIEPSVIRIISETDGYHWLQYWMSQDCYTPVLKDWPFTTQIMIINAEFKYLGMYWKQEDKETAFISADREFDIYDLNQVAIILDRQFAIRERFFPNE